MYRTTFKMRGSDHEVTISEENKEEFTKIIKSYVHPNSGWSNVTHNLYSPYDKYFYQEIDKCYTAPTEM